MLATAVMLAFAISALGAPDEPQVAVSAPAEPGSRNSTQGVNASGVIRGRVTSLDTGKSLRRAQVRLASEYEFLRTPRTASTSTDGRYEFRDVQRMNWPPIEIAHVPVPSWPTPQSTKPRRSRDG